MFLENVGSTRLWMVSEPRLHPWVPWGDRGLSRRRGMELPPCRALGTRVSLDPSRGDCARPPGTRSPC